MTMQIKFELVGDLKGLLAGEVRRGQSAVTLAMWEAGDRLKTAWRGQITGAGLGQRLANTIQADVFPIGRKSLSAAVAVYSKAAHIVAPHARGAVIRGKQGNWLAIPTKAAPKSLTRGRITPAEYERRTGRRLRFVFRPGRTALLVDDGTLIAQSTGRLKRGAFGPKLPRRFKNRTVPIFTLVPQVTLAKKLDLDGATRLASAGIPGDILARWQRAGSR